MTGLVARTGGSVRLIRTGIELTVLGIGFLLGGTVGVGTVLYAVAIGPLVQFFLPLVSVRLPRLVSSSPRQRADDLATRRGPVGSRWRARMTGWILPRCEEAGAYHIAVGTGLVSYGLIHLVLAWIAIQVALGKKGDASQTGALTQLAEQPLGGILLWVMAIGLFTLTIWQLLEATIGREESGRDSRPRRRIASAGRAIVYLAFGILAVGVVTVPVRSRARARKRSRRS